jgi:UDP-glucose 4-epimerase
VLRLTNVYGPRMALNVPGQGFLGAFFRQALNGAPLAVFGDGSQVRDPVYIDDVVQAFLLAGATADRTSRTYNIGGPEALSLGAIGETVARAGGSTVELREFPEASKAIDIGSYYADTARIRRDLGWTAPTTFEEGVRRTVEYYRRNLAAYLPRERASSRGFTERPPALAPVTAQ